MTPANEPCFQCHILKKLFELWIGRQEAFSCAEDFCAHREYADVHADQHQANGIHESIHVKVETTYRALRRK